MDNIRRSDTYKSSSPVNRPHARRGGLQPPTNLSQKRRKPPAVTKPQQSLQREQSLRSAQSLRRVPRERLAKFDIPLFVIVLTLMVFGLVMLLSASSSFADREHGNSYFYFNRQLGFAIAGLFVMIVVSFVPYRIFLDKKVASALVVGTVVLMLAVLLGGLAQGGAVRWIRIAGIEFQPSEIMKYTLIVVLAYVVHKWPGFLQSHRVTSLDTKSKWVKYSLFAFRIPGFTGFAVFGLIIAFAAGLTIVQPHLSGAVIMLGIGIVLMIASPVRLPYLIIAFGLFMAIASAVLPIMESMGFTYVEDRLLSFRDPEADIRDATFQTYQSLVTIGSGGWFGLGLGNSRQKFSYLPATHNDFIFSVVCEELGFVGGVLVLMLFVVFILRGFYIARHARDRFGMMLAAGITAQIGIQAFLNIAVATNSVPNTGILLPFFSYGGTAMLMLLLQIGVLLNISRKAAIE